MRNLSTAMSAAITARLVQPAILAQLTFKSGTVYVWIGRGDLVWNGNTFKGVGNLGGIGTITETTTVQAAGTSVSLSGVDPTLYADCVSDIVTGKPAKIWLACLNGNTVIDALLMFSGLIDIPTVTEGPDDIAISLALENRLTNLQRASRKLYTSSEQRRKYPNDSGFDYVEVLQDTANLWG